MVLDIKLVGWVPGDWSNYNSRVTLAGNAAYAMTSYRGEVFNHSVPDAAALSKYLNSAWWPSSSFNAVENAVTTNGVEMWKRTYEAVLLSMQARFDVHYLNAVDPDSPAVSKTSKPESDRVPLRDNSCMA